MGKGDKKSAKGKRSMGSYGKSRPRKSNKVAIVKTAEVKSAPAKKETKAKA